MKKLITVLVLAAIAQVGAASPVVKSVVMRQLWPWSSDIRVEYKLDKGPGLVDIAMTAEYGGKTISNAELLNASSGDILVVDDAMGVITIDAVKLFGDKRLNLDDFKLTLSVSESSASSLETLYKIFDLDSGECENVTRGELLSGRRGAVETDFAKLGESFGVNEENFGDQRFNTTLEDVIIWTGVTNVPAYKTTKLVMRKIPARGANFIMGRNDGDLYNTSHDNFEPHQVSFTNDFYIGVFEFTYGQAETLYAKLPTKPGYSIIFTNSLDKSMRPVLMRASHTRAGLAKWPWGGREETANTLIKVLRDRTNILFDLPTEAQWEYACRAGTTTDWNCGLSSQAGNDQRMKMLQSIISRCSYNSGFTPSNLGGNSTNYNVRAEVGGTAFPGCYAPNAWGLYDMHGNMSELCLDYYVDDLSNYGGDDPWGPSPGDGIENLDCRVRRGGTFYLCNQYNCVSSRGQNDASKASSYHGGRVLFMVYE